MKKLKYNLIAQQNIILEGDTTYKFENNFLIFNVDEIVIKININQKIFIRETNEDRFVISQKNNKNMGQFTLFNPLYTFCVDIEKFEIINNENHIKLNYKISGDDSGEKALNIFF